VSGGEGGWFVNLCAVLWLSCHTFMAVKRISEAYIHYISQKTPSVTFSLLWRRSEAWFRVWL